MKQFNVKCIDWKSKITKISHYEPKWRKESQPQAPKITINKYALPLENKIRNGIEDLNGKSVSTDYANFLAEGEASAEKMRQKLLQTQPGITGRRNHQSNSEKTQHSSFNNTTGRVIAKPKYKGRKEILREPPINHHQSNPAKVNNPNKRPPRNTPDFTDQLNKIQ